jgi:hypothetical protein
MNRWFLLISQSRHTGQICRDDDFGKMMFLVAMYSGSIARWGHPEFNKGFILRKALGQTPHILLLPGFDDQIVLIELSVIVKDSPWKNNLFAACFTFAASLFTMHC